MRKNPTQALRTVGAHLKEIAGFGDPSVDDFRLELAKLDLLGRPFGPVDYARALEEQLGIRIVIEDFPDLRLSFAKREAMREGTLAEVLYAEERGEALILVRESLHMRPWPAYDLALYHELSHLAARHPEREKNANDLGRMTKGLRFLIDASRLVGPLPTGERRQVNQQEYPKEIYESEARRRARWLVLASTYPDSFEKEGVNRLG